MSHIPLGQHALLSDCGAAALVTSAGSVDWLCLPRFDHPSVFTNQVARSRQVLEGAAATANGLGLMAEQVDPNSVQLLGNFPQAFSHLGLINAAQALADAERRERGRADA